MNDHRVKGVDHAAFPTFDPAATVRFYRDTLKFPVVHSICAAGWGPEDHPDFIHFFFDTGNDDRIAFFYYFGLEPAHTSERGDVYAGFGPDVPDFFVNSRHLAIHVDSEDPYFRIDAGGGDIVIERRATGCRHAVWYSALAGLQGARVAQHDKNALRVVRR